MSDAITDMAENELLASVAPEAAAPGDSLVSNASPAVDLPADSLNRIDDMLAQLGEVQHRVLRLLFGLDGDTPSSPSQIGDALNMTVEQVNDLHVGALSRLRATSHEGLALSDN